MQTRRAIVFIDDSRQRFYRCQQSRIRLDTHDVLCGQLMKTGVSTSLRHLFTKIGVNELSTGEASAGCAQLDVAICGNDFRYLPRGAQKRFGILLLSQIRDHFMAYVSGPVVR
jgi:hypothetical protein